MCLAKITSTCKQCWPSLDAMLWLQTNLPDATTPNTSLACTTKHANIINSNSAVCPHHIWKLQCAPDCNFATIKQMKSHWPLPAEWMKTTPSNQVNNTPESLPLACHKHSATTEPLTVIALNPMLPSQTIEPNCSWWEIEQPMTIERTTIIPKF